MSEVDQVHRIRLRTTYSGGTLLINPHQDKVWYWGNHFVPYREETQDEDFEARFPTLIEGVTGVVDGIMDRGCALLLTDTGEVWSLGVNIHGILGRDVPITGYTGGGYVDEQYEEPGKIEGLPPIVSLALESHSAFAIDEDGVLWAWGTNLYRGLGFHPDHDYHLTDGSDYASTPLQVPNVPPMKSCYKGHVQSFAVSQDGEIWTWGYGGFSGYPYNSSEDVCANWNCSSWWEAPKGPMTFSGNSGVVKVTGSNTSTLTILKEDGSVWGKGNNYYGDMGVGTWYWQNNDESQAYFYEPVQILGPEHNVIDIVGYENGADALKADGTLITWGNDYRPRGGVYDADWNDVDGAPLSESSHWSEWPYSDIVAVSTQSGTTLVLREDCTVWAAGGSPWQRGGASEEFWLRQPERVVLDAEQTVDPAPTMNWIRAGGNNSLSVIGGGFYGSVYREAKEEPEPLQVEVPRRYETEEEPEGPIEIVPSSHGHAVLRCDGTVWRTGRQYEYDPSNATLYYKGVEYPYFYDMGITDVKSLVSENNWYFPNSSGFTMLALKNDGTVWSYGQNQRGQLGIGTAGVLEPNPNGSTNSTSADRYEWVPVLGNMPEIVQISIGHYSAALDVNGDVWTWGLNYYPGLIDGSWQYNNTYVTLPKKLVGLPQVKYISVGATDLYNTGGRGGTTHFVDMDGEIWAWGQNHNGYLGMGFIGRSPYPNYAQYTEIIAPTKMAGGLANAVKIIPGDPYMALLEDGTAWAWGRVWNGVGDGGYRTYVSTPMQIMPDNPLPIVDIYQGYRSYAAKTSDGQMYYWGEDAFWHYGDPAYNTKYRTALPFPSDQPLKTILPSYLFVKEDSSVWGWGETTWEKGVGIRFYGAYQFERAITSVEIEADPAPSMGIIRAGGNDSISILSGGGSYGSVRIYDAPLVEPEPVPIRRERGETKRLGSSVESKMTSASLYGDSANLPQILVTPMAAYVIASDGEMWSWGMRDYGSLWSADDFDDEYDELISLGIPAEAILGPQYPGSEDEWIHDLPYKSRITPPMSKLPPAAGGAGYTSMIAIDAEGYLWVANDYGIVSGYYQAIGNHLGYIDAPSWHPYLNGHGYSEHYGPVRLGGLGKVTEAVISGWGTCFVRREVDGVWYSCDYEAFWYDHGPAKAIQRQHINGVYNPDSAIQRPFEPADLLPTGIVKIFASDISERFFGITEDGTLYSWGDANYGALGRGESPWRSQDQQAVDDFHTIPAVVDLPSPVVKVTSGDENTLILCANGDVYFCGDAGQGASGTLSGTPADDGIFYPVKTFEDAKDIACSWYGSHVLKNDGTYWACGLSLSGHQLGLDEPWRAEIFQWTQATNPELYAHGEIVAISSTFYVSMVLTDECVVLTCGTDVYGQSARGEGQPIGGTHNEEGNAYPWTPVRISYEPTTDPAPTMSVIRAGGNNSMSVTP